MIDRSGASASLVGGVKGLGSRWMLVTAAAMMASSSAYAESSVELMVRYRQPQNTRLQAFQSALASVNSAQGIESAEVVNAEEGVVKLRFKSAEEALAAQAQLSRSENVLNISENLLYRPALKIESRIVEEPSVFTAFAAPFAAMVNGLANAIPDVQLPPSSVRFGADPLAAQDWALKNIHMPETNSAPTERLPVISAVIDTGFDYNHEDLVGAMWRKPSNPQEVGYDFAHNNAKPYDVVLFDIEGCLKDRGCRNGVNTEKFMPNPGHGTHCMGHVAATANNSLGIRGIGAGSPVMGLKMFYDAGELNAGSGDDAAAIKSIDYAIKNGAKVISASWGGRQSAATAEKSELKQALIRAQKAGVIVVIAAGNDGINQDTDSRPSYPAAYNLDNLIIVAASDPNDKVAAFSNYGPKSVHIAAPGVRILSTAAGNKYQDVIASYQGGDGKTHEIAWDGTSMATPIVAGAVVAVWSQFPTYNYQQVRNRIFTTARKVPGLESKVSTGAILNVAAALGVGN